MDSKDNVQHEKIQPMEVSNGDDARSKSIIDALLSPLLNPLEGSTM
jgi:hypothetical protein